MYYIKQHDILCNSNVVFYPRFFLNVGINRPRPERVIVLTDSYYWYQTDSHLTTIKFKKSISDNYHWLTADDNSDL